MSDNEKSNERRTNELLSVSKSVSLINLAILDHRRIGILKQYTYVLKLHLDVLFYRLMA
jgi:hypothetical protein